MIVLDRLINILLVLSGVVINFVVGISCCVFAVLLIENVFVVCYARVHVSLGGLNRDRRRIQSLYGSLAR